VTLSVFAACSTVLVTVFVGGRGERAIEPQPAAVAPAAPAAAEAVGVQRWKGAIELPGVKLDFAVTLTPAGAGSPASGTIDIPLQGVKAAALADVVVASDELKFTLVIPNAPPAMSAVFSATPAADGTAAGQLQQGGATFPVKMERIALDADISPRRPQEPKPPFPYVQREVSYSNPDGTKLAGTLTLPPGPGPFAAAILITGSGPQDRDESLLGHKPFLVIADHLTRNGFAVLRADDRGVGGSTGSVANTTAEGSVGDVLAAVALLKTMPEVDPARIGVIGHSEGGIIGPMAAARSRDVSFVVMLAGTGLKGRDILTMQSEAIYRAAGGKEELIRSATEEHRRLMDLLEKDAPPEEVRASMRSLTKVQIEMSGAGGLPDEQLEAAITQQLVALQTPWFRSFLLLDPREALRKVTVPVLALNGSLDVQVPAKANLAEIEKALGEAGNTHVTVREMPGLNHLFQTAGTGGPDEYAQIEETFSPGALDVMTEWLRANCK
jgi:pimeloyl-ACP methyl ester carboxylesterase